MPFILRSKIMKTHAHVRADASGIRNCNYPTSHQVLIIFRSPPSFLKEIRLYTHILMLPVLCQQQPYSATPFLPSVLFIQAGRTSVAYLFFNMKRGTGERNEQIRPRRVLRLRTSTTSRENTSVAPTPTLSNDYNTPPTLRRSGRISIPTTRANQFAESRETRENTNTTHPHFPSVGDSIVVQWLLGETLVWWPAVVITVDLDPTRQPIRHGEITYTPFQHYGSETMHVVFYYLHSTCSRLVSHGKSTFDPVNSDSNLQLCSWTFEHDPDIDIDNVLTGQDIRTIPSERALNQSTHSLTSNPPSNAVERNEAFRPDNNYQEKGRSVSQPNPSLLSPASALMFPSVVYSAQPTSIPPSLQMRLELIERKLVDVNTNNPPHSSATTESVLVTLKWALLRQLEKPLKALKLPELSTLGVAQSSYVVSAQCDDATFRDLTSSMVRTHQYFQGSKRTGRIAFTPSYDIIQSGSCAVNELTVIFSSLSDVAALLNIRDDKDYESMVVKESVNESSSFLRLLGTYSVSQTPSAGTKTTADASKSFESSSVCANSNDVSTTQHEKYLQLYVASAPVAVTDDKRTEAIDGGSHTGLRLFRTVVIEQKCAHFSKVSNAFQTPWRVKRCSSNFNVACDFDLDGEVRECNLSEYFTLSWSPLVQPSCKKWTRDIRFIGEHCPGNLRLTVPYIFFSAHKNVKDLSVVLDNTIEYFMSLRSKVRMSAQV